MNYMDKVPLSTASMGPGWTVANRADLIELISNYDQEEQES